MKKGLLLLAVLMVVFALILCACENKKEETPVEEKVEEVVEEVSDVTEEVVENVVDPADLEKLVVEYNGATCKIGEKFEDVKGRLGEERKPAQSYTPCGGSDDAQNITHYYNGVDIEELADGTIYYAKISGFDYPTSQASIAGIKLGATPEEVKANFGTKPDVENEYVINYTFGKIALSFNLDVDESGNVNSISMDDFSLGGV